LFGRYAGLVALFWLKPLWRGEALFYDTLLRLFHPNFVFVRKSLLSGEFPFWNPHLYAGVPFLANMQSALFYPTTGLGLGLSFSSWMWVNTWFHGTLACFLMARWAKDLGLSYGASFFAGAIFGLNGFFVMHYAYPSNLQSYAWAPGVLLGLGRLADKPSKKTLAGTALCLAAQIFGGHPQFVIYTLLAGILQAAWTARPTRAFGWLLCGSAWGALISAAQWIPFLFFLQRSPRGLGLDVERLGAYSLAPLEFLRMAVTPAWNRFWTPMSGDPHIVGFYFGPLIAFLVLIGVKGNPWNKVRLFLAVGALGLLLAFGRHWFFYHTLSAWVPFRWMSLPAQALALVGLAVPILSGLGLDRLRSSRVRWGLGMLAFLDLGFFAWGAQETLPSRVYEEPSTTARFILFREPGARFLVSPRTRAVRGEQGVDPLRAWLRLKDTLLPNIGMGQGLLDVVGNEEMRFADFDRVIDKMGGSPLSPWLNLFSVRHVVSREVIPGAPWVLGRTSVPLVYENTNALPRAYVAPRALGVAERDVFRFVEDHPDHNYLEEVLLPGSESTVSSGGRGEAVLRSASANRLAFNVTASSPAWLVVADAYDPEWRARVNGREVPIVRANFFQRAVHLKGGNETVEMTYRPPFFRTALLGSVLAGLTAGFLLAGPFLRKGKKGAPAPTFI
jgi:hypothetical protein